MVAKKKKLRSIKNKTEINKPKPKTIQHKEKVTKENKIVDGYYSAILFLMFSVFFIIILIIFVNYVFGSKYLWTIIPFTLVLWGISYLVSKKIFKSKR